MRINHPKSSGFIFSGDDSASNLITKTWIWMEKIPHLNCIIIPEQNQTIYDSFLVSQGYGLLAIDAYIAAFAKSYKISNITTNDADFELLPWLKVWKQREITHQSYESSLGHKEVGCQ